MNAKVIDLLISLIELTKKARIKWTDGSEPDEFYFVLERKAIFVSKKDTANGIEYCFSIKSDDNHDVVTIKATSFENDLFSKMDELFNSITYNSVSAGLAIDELLHALNNKDNNK